jgi:hypothetical protein
MQVHHKSKAELELEALNSRLGVEDKDLALPPINSIPSIDFVPHTIFLLCGPTMSGKSTFAEDLVYLAESNGLTYSILSSEENRKSMLWDAGISDSGDRYSDLMSSVSPQAFEKLMLDLKLTVSFPICTQIVVMDTTGMDERFRNEVKAIGTGAGYRVCLVTFEYKTRSNYYPENASANVKDIVSKSAARFRQKVLPSLGARDFDGRIRIKSREAFGWDVPREETWWDESVLSEWVDNAISPLGKNKIEIFLSCTEYHGSYLDTRDDPIYGVIGDSHECVEELAKLIEILETRFPHIRIVHVGDYLDKGKDTEKMINFMYDRMGMGDLIVVGNHENYVAKRIRGELKPNLDLEQSYFTSVPVLLADPDLAAKFLDIFSASKEFLKLGRDDSVGGNPFYVTQAPCDIRALGKVHDQALREQRNYFFKDRTKPIMEEFEFLYGQARYEHPLHIFGHVSHTVTEWKGFKYKNKVWLDSGAVYGGKLTACVVEHGRVVDFISVDCKARDTAELPSNLGYGPKPKERIFNLADYDLDIRDLRLLKQVEENGVQYISGTMAPAPSQGGEIEPLLSAFDWYRKLGIKQVVLQPKYMGSRCQFYLSESEPYKTFCVSRGGWVIKGLEGKTEEEFKTFLKETREKFVPLLDEFGDLILDGELLPWSALGQGLIDNSFDPYEKLVGNQLVQLGLGAWPAELSEFKESLKINSKLQNLGRFVEVLGRYSKKTPAEFRAFDVLKWENKEALMPKTASGRFNLVNKDSQFLVNLEDEDSVASAAKFFTGITVEQDMEGVVVKPNEPCELPYMKVRSTEYLRLVYGYDYLDTDRYARLCRQKRVEGKVRLSIKEHKLATAMLEASGDAKKEIVVKLIGEMKLEKELDPRL